MTWFRQLLDHYRAQQVGPWRGATAGASPAAALLDEANAHALPRSSRRWCAPCDVEWTGPDEPCWVCETHEHVCDAAARTEHEDDDE